MDLFASCSLDDEQLSVRQKEWAALKPALIESSETSDGYTAVYRADERIARMLEALIVAERECCSDLDWRISREGRLVRLEVTARTPA